jgi:hypothetical protein
MGNAAVQTQQNSSRGQRLKDGSFRKVAQTFQLVTQTDFFRRMPISALNVIQNFGALAQQSASQQRQDLDMEMKDEEPSVSVVCGSLPLRSSFCRMFC